MMKRSFGTAPRIVGAANDHYERAGESIKSVACQESEIITIDSSFALESRKKSYNALENLNNKNVTELK